jgi:hypothetical protein
MLFAFSRKISVQAPIYRSYLAGPSQRAEEIKKGAYRSSGSSNAEV